MRIRARMEYPKGTTRLIKCWPAPPLYGVGEWVFHRSLVVAPAEPEKIYARGRFICYTHRGTGTVAAIATTSLAALRQARERVRVESAVSGRPPKEIVRQAIERMLHNLKKSPRRPRGKR